MQAIHLTLAALSGRKAPLRAAVLGARADHAGLNTYTRDWVGTRAGSHAFVMVMASAIGGRNPGQSFLAGQGAANTSGSKSNQYRQHPGCIPQVAGGNL